MHTPKCYDGLLGNAAGYPHSTLEELLSSRDIILNGKTLADIWKYVVYVLDYTQKRFLYCDEYLFKSMGYPIGYFLDGGVEAVMRIWDQNDMDFYSKKVLCKNVEYNYKNPNRNIFLINYRVKHRLGGYKNIEQRSIYIKSCPKGWPLVTVGLALDDITHRKDSRNVHVIQSHDTNMYYNERYFFESSCNLTKREIEVLKLKINHFTTAMMAKELHISDGTVKSHLANIKDKIGVSSTKDIILYANNLGQSL